MRRLAPTGDAAHRTIDEARILELMRLYGWAFEVRARGRPGAEREAAAALDRCVALGLPHARSATGARLFDPAELVQFVNSVGAERGEPIWNRWVAGARALVWEAYGKPGDAALPPVPETLGPRRYAVTFRRTFNLEGRTPGERVRLRSPLPLDDGALTGLAVEILPPPDPDARTVVAPARLDVLVPVPAGAMATIGFQASFTAHPIVATGAAAPLDPAEREVYTRPNEGLIKVSDRVAALAGKLTAGITDPQEIVRRIWDFMLDDLGSAMVRYDQLPATRPLDAVLEGGWMDCQVGSALFAALCRARGLPARLVGGWMLHPASPDIHTWAEVWIEGTGWFPVDLWSWVLSGGGRDTAWRNHFFGRLGHRVPTQRPPRLFNGPGGVRLPRAWHMLPSMEGAGNSVAYHALDTGALIYRDHIVARRLD